MERVDDYAVRPARLRYSADASRSGRQNHGTIDGKTVSTMGLHAAARRDRGRFHSDLQLSLNRCIDSLLNHHFFFVRCGQLDFAGVFQAADDIDDLLLHRFDFR